MIVEIFLMHREEKNCIRREAGDSTKAGSPEGVEGIERTLSFNLFCHFLV